MLICHSGRDLDLGQEEEYLVKNSVCVSVEVEINLWGVSPAVWRSAREIDKFWSVKFPSSYLSLCRFAFRHLICVSRSPKVLKMNQARGCHCKWFPILYGACTIYLRTGEWRAEKGWGWFDIPKFLGLLIN